VPSFENIKKVWDGFLNKIIFTLHISRSLNNSGNVLVKRVTNIDVGELFNVFIERVGEEWVKYLEINEEEFTERVLGSACCEAFSRSLLRKMILKKEQLIAKQNDKLLGYCVYMKPSMYIDKVVRKIELLVLPRVFSPDINKLRVCVPLINRTGFNSFHWIDDISREDELIKAGYKIVSKEFVCYKNL
jgi:hypothetical protein